MRKRISKQNKQERATISLKKIFIMALIFLILAGTMSVMATNQKLISVKILLSSGYEMDVMTTSTKVSDILAENHIVVLDGESVTPAIDEELSDNKTITITKGATEANTDEDYMSAEEILASYTQIVEKVVTEEVEIPFETVTKDVSNGSSTTQNRVVQNGENGLKRVTYRIRYQNGAEIEKTEISSEIIKEPVDKIVEVRTKQVTSRGGVVSGSVAEYQAYAEKRCFDYGWSDADFQALVKLWNKESRWNPYASNSSSGAYGIPQALPASKMATYGTDYRTNYKTQIEWGLSYIKSRYGTPSAAWNHSCTKGWY